ncbi:c2h2 transcription factor protein [Rutstroemia sp. NJR-2017a BBW]|nr:c2h2 transcription factor protein [Rutstroemia sp. NJR-2017a BBW]
MSGTHPSNSPVLEAATQGSYDQKSTLYCGRRGRLAGSNAKTDAHTNKRIITRDVVPAEKSENGLLRHQPHAAQQTLTQPSGTNLHLHYNNHTHPQHNRSILESGNYHPFAQHYADPFDPATTNFYQNYDRAPFTVNMSLSYESRSFMTDTQYPLQMAHEPQETDEFKHDEPRYPSPPPPLSENPYTAQPMTAPEEHPIIEPQMELPEIPKDEEDAPSPGRSKPVPKPDREVTKDANGRFYCAWPGCTEEVRDFGRKCEWSKHMDKHDRPYRCKEAGCEKLPGFTYSGGLLRHEREVHGKHGGPKKQLNCPHPNCKRHTGKGFSRQENLNEHLRRVHTDGGITQVAVEEAEEDPTQAVAGGKRKRGTSKGDSDLREEMKRMKAENEELKRQYDAQQVQCAEMMRQLVELQNLAGMQHQQRMAPQAPM